MTTKVAVVFLIISFICVVAINYDGFKVYKVVPKSDTEINFLRRLQENSDFDIWSRIIQKQKRISIMVAPRSQNLFEKFLSENYIVFDIEINDVGRMIVNQELQRDSQLQFRFFSTPIEEGGITFDRYYRHAEINAYLAYLAKNYPEIVTLENIGQSYERRNMTVIKISSEPGQTKPVIFIDAGIHAREWIAPAFALYIINQLVENPTNAYLLENVDWFILPSANPDGYEYSWDVDRFWRKTVSKGKNCNGCDPNRNFDIHWMESGSKSDECSITYAGKRPFSEVETRNIRDFILKNTEKIQAYLTLHSYGPAILYPWGYDKTLCDNWKELDQLAHEMNAAIVSANGKKNLIGSAGKDLYPAAGGSDDWARAVAGIKIVFTMELPGGGSEGFNMPENRIKEVVQQNFEGVKVLGNYVAHNKQR